MTRWLLWVISCWCGVACSGSGTRSESDSISLKAFEFSEYCAETGALHCDRCRADVEDEREECFRVCAALAERTGSSTCFASCESSRSSCDAQCSLDPDECAVSGFRFEPSLPADAVIAAACTSANVRNRSCRQSPIRTDCDQSSRLERPETAQVYACLSELECDADGKPCLARLGSSSFGASLAESCLDEPLEDALISAVNAAAVWARAEVLDDAAVCSEQACSEQRFAACVQAWVGAL
jgi:hypothetical protein